MKAARSNTTIRNDTPVAMVRLPRFFPGKCIDIQCTGAFSARLKKNAMKIRVNACDACFMADSSRYDPITSRRTCMTVRLDTVTSTCSDFRENNDISLLSTMPSWLSMLLDINLPVAARRYRYRTDQPFLVAKQTSYLVMPCQ